MLFTLFFNVILYIFSSYAMTYIFSSYAVTPEEWVMQTQYNNPVKSYNGVEYSLIKIGKDIPLVFQWFHHRKNNNQYKDDEIPIINTADNPYLDNIINAAKIEKDRVVGVFVDGFTEGQKKAIKKLELNSNIKVIHKSDLDFKEFDVPRVDIVNNHIASIVMSSAVNKDTLRYYKEMKQFIEKNDAEQTLLSNLDKKQGHVWFDMYRNLFMLKGSSAFHEARKSGCEHLGSEQGCIYLDCDMVLTDEIGDMYLPDGIGLHVSRDRDNNAALENSIIAVNRRNHPALRSGLILMHENIKAHPYDDGVCEGIKTHFNYQYSSPLNHNEFCDFVEFKNKNINMDTSNNTKSTWRSGAFPKSR